MRITVKLLTVLLVMAVGACAKPETPESAAAKWGAPLGGDAIRATLSGATETWQIVDREKPLRGTQTYKADGTASGTYVWDNKETGDYTVRWTVKNDMYCGVTLTMNGKPKDDPESCSKVYVKDGTYYFVNPDGRMHGSSTVSR